jgi:hypothetical protein
MNRYLKAVEDHMTKIAIDAAPAIDLARKWNLNTGETMNYFKGVERDTIKNPVEFGMNQQAAAKTRNLTPNLLRQMPNQPENGFIPGA